MSIEEEIREYHTEEEHGGTARAVRGALLWTLITAAAAAALVWFF